MVFNAKIFSFVLQIGKSAAVGGQSSCPGGNGGSGGNAGNWPPHRAPHCYDKSAEGGNVGTSALGGGAGTELTSFVTFGLQLMITQKRAPLPQWQKRPDRSFVLRIFKS